ncbi:MAG TPA: CinA family protein [Gammaproteobacteria bacterium]|nr:CinA family protein [Gammaproteobacteria bacterium]
MNEQSLQLFVQQLGVQLVAQNLTLATAESCTGGWVSKIITDIDGSSRWFDCALVTYSNQSKHDLLGVSLTTLEQFGAVSQPVVKEMVLGLLDRCNASLGVSISGIAGPGGGTADKPVGTVWIAWARPGRVIESMRFQFSGDREQVRLQAVEQALKGVQRLLADG